MNDRYGMRELDQEADAFEVDSYETDAYEFDEAESEYETEFDEGEMPLDEVEEMELAAQLLEITDEQELDQFLGKIFKKVWKGVKKIGRPLGGLLKKVAKVGLPIAGKIAGGFFGGPLGGAIGGKLGSGAAKLFGLELEGLSPEDQEFEVARRYVRLAASAARNASRVAPSEDPRRAAKRALIKSARRHAPGLLKRRRRGTPGRGRRRGRWGGWVPAAGAGALAVSGTFPPEDAAPPMGADTSPDGNGLPASDGAGDMMPDGSDGASTDATGLPTNGANTGGANTGGDEAARGRPTTGRWFRQGGRVVLYNC